MTVVKAEALPVEKVDMKIDITFDSQFELAHVAEDCQVILDKCWSARLHDEKEGDLCNPLREILQSIVDAYKEFDKKQQMDNGTYTGEYD